MAEAMIIPRALSVDEAGYNWRLGPKLEIFVDGVKQDKVISYDIDAGVVVRHKLTDDGSYVLNETRDETVRETITGDVVVRWKSDDAPHEQVGRGQRPG